MPPTNSVVRKSQITAVIVTNPPPQLYTNRVTVTGQVGWYGIARFPTDPSTNIVGYVTNGGTFTDITTMSNAFYQPIPQVPFTARATNH